MNHLKTHQTNPTTAQYRPVQSNTSTAQYTKYIQYPNPTRNPNFLVKPDPKLKSPTRQTLIIGLRAPSVLIVTYTSWNICPNDSAIVYDISYIEA